MAIDYVNSSCDEQLLRGYLGQDLRADQEAMLERHLDQCPHCRERIRTSAADEQWWAAAGNYLKRDDMDEIAESCSLPLQGASAGSSQVILRQIREWLDPTDDPRYIGRFGGYEVLGVVGFGMGVVLKGFEPSLNRYVAIKILAPSLAASGAARQRFAREAQAAAAVLHENVISIHRVDQSHGLPFLVMPFVSGLSLQRRIDDEGPLPLAAVLRIGRQIAAGLAAAHAQGLVHRDIKPANILLDRGVERVTITDFGLARAADDGSLTKTGVIAGTPQYMSPEQSRGEAIDVRSDLFSLGSVLYAMCTGRPPFRAETGYATLRRVTDDQPRAIREINPEIPEWLCQLIGKLMAKQAADRYQSAAEVAELLEACLAHVQQPTVAKLPPALQPAARESRFFSMSRRGSGVIAMIAAFGLGLLGLLAWLATAAPDIAGNWSGEEWGEVSLTKTADGEYSGTYSDTFKESPGTIEVTWSRLERRYKGAWREGQERSGKISLRLVDNEIRGAWTTSKKSEINPGTPELADLTWRRSEQAKTDNGVARLVLVFFDDQSRRAIPCLVVNADGATFAVAAGPATVVPDGTTHAVDRAFIEVAGKSQPIPAEYDSRSTAELHVYRVKDQFEGIELKKTATVTEGDSVTPVTISRIVPQQANVVGFGRRAKFELPDRQIERWYEGLIEVDQAFPEGTPLFKDGKLVGLTLLGSRFVGEKAKKSYLVPADRITEWCKGIGHEATQADVPGIRVRVLISAETHSREMLQKNIGSDQLSIMGRGFKGSVNGQPHDNIEAVMAHGCRLERFDETASNGPQKYWRATLFVPQDSKSDGANLDLSQKRIDGLLKEGGQFWLDHLRDTPPPAAEMQVKGAAPRNDWIVRVPGMIDDAPVYGARREELQLGLQIKSDRREFAIGSELKFDYIIKNVGKNPVQFEYEPLHPGGHAPRIRNQHGERQLLFGVVATFERPFYAVTLQPGEVHRIPYSVVLGKRAEGRLLAAWESPQPGRYLLDGGLRLNVLSPTEADKKFATDLLSGSVAFEVVEGPVDDGLSHDPADEQESPNASRKSEDDTKQGVKLRPKSLSEVAKQFNAQTAEARRDLFDPPIEDLSVERLREGFRQTAELYRRQGKNAIADATQMVADSGRLPKGASELIATGVHAQDEAGQTVSRQIVPAFTLPDADTADRLELILLRPLELIYRKNGPVSKDYGDQFVLAEAAADEASALSKGLKFLAPYPQLHKLSIDMTEKEFLAIVESQKFKVSKWDGKTTYSIPTGDGHRVIVMFSDDAEKCRGIQRLRGE